MKPIIVTKLFNAKIEDVWSALTDAVKLNKWYFPVKNFELEVGKTFTFYESEEGTRFFHSCTFLQIFPEKILEYTWTHPNDSKCSSIVKWELKSNDQKTSVTLTHSGVEKFADAGPEFSVSNFEMGWEAILKTMLRNFLYGIEKLTFEIEINATCETIWSKLWENDNYSIWTAPFCEGSYFTGDLVQGNRVHFLSPSGEGMYSDVAFLIENKLMMFKHVGMVKNLKELPLDEKTETWTGSYENYHLSRISSGTSLRVEVDTVSDFKSYMEEKFPLALKLLKEICEN
jgi:uncharacterized protein YndB with AHSA1/START domain